MHITAARRPLPFFLTRIALFLNVIVLTGLPACDRAEQQPVRIDTATIAVSSTYHSLLVLIAQEKGYFRQEGLEVTVRPQPYGKRSLEDMMAGNADFAIAAETPVMFAIMDGKDIAIIATIHTSNTDHAIVVRKDKGISAPEDLRGRKIATTFGITTDYFLDTFLAINAISRNEVELFDLRQEELPRALAQGEIDAISVFKPYLTRAQEQLGERGATFYNTNIYTQSVMVVSGKELIRKNPAIVSKLLRALYLAEKYFKQYPDEAANITARVLQENVAAIRHNLAETTVELSLDETIILNLEDQSRWAIKNGRTNSRNIPDYLEYIFTEGLSSVNPAAVRILE